MKIILLLFFATGILGAHAQQFTLIKDINPGSSTSSICYLTHVNNKLFFAANNGVNGMELWISDGTTAGTVLVKDINAGATSSSIGYLTDVNGTLFFVANNGSLGTELWKSDGTAAGTQLVKDIRSGVMGSNPSALVNVNGVLFFSADDGINGTELWKSDGTDAGTVLVKNINAGGGSCYPQSLANVNGVLFFAANDGVKGMELWKSDGTTGGTVLVKDIWNGASDGYPFDLTCIGTTLFFAATTNSAGTELWKSDGTAAGTTLVKDVWNGNNDGYPFGLKNVGGTLFFSADNGASGIELWKSDGSSSGTMLVKDIWPGAPSGAVGNFSKLINKLIFTGNDGVNGYKTWQSDGTSAGTKIATGFADPGNGELRELVETGSKIFASIQEDVNGRELWGLSYSVVLPLDLLEFKGKLVKNDAQLDWRTESELNTEEFFIERSIDGSKFEAVGRIAAKNTSGINDYQYADAGITRLGSPVVYYRLKQVDADSRFTYSAVVSIFIKNRNEIILYPNPAISRIDISAGMQVQGNVQLSIFDNSGKMITRVSKTANPNLSLDISNLSAGVYYLDIRGANLEKRMQFVKRP
jgi:ELWxxDGT repeat protein